MLHQNEGNKSSCADIYPRESGLMLIKLFFNDQKLFSLPKIIPPYDFKLFLTELKILMYQIFQDTSSKNACSNPLVNQIFPNFSKMLLKDII